MKNNLSIMSRFAVVAMAAGGLCLAATAFGQVEKDTAPEPGKVGSMAAVGTKPSKAEKAKMEAENATKTPAKANDKAAKATDKAMGKLDMGDQVFIREAAKGGMMEVEMGKMAAKQGKSPAVQELGRMLVTDHTQANSELMALAKQKGVKVDPKVKMAKIGDANFDSEFLTMAMQDHQKDIAMFERQAKNGKDAETKAWAKKTLPTLKKHMKMVKKAQGSMKKAG